MATFATFFFFFQLLLFFLHLVVVSLSHLFHKLQHGGKDGMIKDRATHVAANAFHAFFELPFLDGEVDVAQRVLVDRRIVVLANVVEYYFSHDELRS